MGDMLSHLSPATQLVLVLVVAAGTTMLLLLRSARRASGGLAAELASAREALLVAQEELRRLADRDPLTGLPNRRAIPEAFRACFATGAALVFCDLDHLKRLNDEQGNAAGDAALMRFTKALGSTFRPTDTIIRYGGDEFLVICPGMPVALAEDRIDVMRGRMLRMGPTEPPVAFAAGIAELAAGADATAALTQATEAMYAVKSESRVVVRSA